MPMNVLLFGATGMVGQGVLRECLLDADVRLVQTIGRAATGEQHPRLSEIVHADLFDYAGIEPPLTLAAALTLARLNPQMTFIYVSGSGTDSSERGRWMWARVKGKTENALLRLPFKAAYMFRPGFIQPLHGIESKTPLYRVFYKATGPILPFLRQIFPNQVLTTEQIGRAMLNAAKRGAAKQILEAPDIRALAEPHT
jgi:uncharacterized protein YbjT (DUF2867 family)